jgi:hypothetical protein
MESMLEEVLRWPLAQIVTCVIVVHARRRQAASSEMLPAQNAAQYLTCTTQYKRINNPDGSQSGCSAGSHLMLFRPDKKIAIADLNLLKKNGSSVGEPAEGFKPTSVTLTSGLSIAVIRTDTGGFIDRVQPVPTSNDEVHDVMNPLANSFATTLDRVD